MLSCLDRGGGLAGCKKREGCISRNQVGVGPTVLERLAWSSQTKRIAPNYDMSQIMNKTMGGAASQGGSSVRGRMGVDRSAPSGPGIALNQANFVRVSAPQAGLGAKSTGKPKFSPNNPPIKKIIIL